MKPEDIGAAVVTGAASGLGEASARALAALGVKVALLDRDAERGPSPAGLHPPSPPPGQPLFAALPRQPPVAVDPSGLSATAVQWSRCRGLPEAASNAAAGGTSAARRSG